MQASIEPAPRSMFVDQVGHPKQEKKGPQHIKYQKGELLELRALSSIHRSASLRIQFPHLFATRTPSELWCRKPTPDPELG